jgi:hypothetical protein
MKRIHGLAASLVLVAALAACAPTPPEPTPTPTVSKPAVKPTLAPSPTPSVTIPPLAIPDCETLVPLDIAREYFSPNTEFLEEQPASDFTGRESLASIPVVLGTASPARVCFWGIPNSGGLFWVNVAGITEPERTTLQGELTAAGYAQTSMGTVTAFQLEGENEVGSVGFTHLFTGDAWIWCDGVSLGQSGAMAGQALDAMRAANPALGL